MKTSNNNTLPLRGVLFDFDGTITLPFFDWKAIKSEMGIGDAAVLDAMAKASPEDRARMKAVMDRWERDAVANAGLREGAREVVAALATLGLEAAIVTNNFEANEDEGYSFVCKQPENDEEIAQMEESIESCPVEAIGNDGE